VILLRKGGIYEAAGEFEIEHRSFLLFPTVLHQKRAMLKPEWQNFVSCVSEPKEITLSLAGEITNIVQIASRMQIDNIDAEHIWSSALIDMRFNYRPENPLYLLLVRAYRLPAPVTIENTPAYAGCKSWVPLERPIDRSSAIPVLDDVRYEQRRNHILETIADAPV
jgi:hypothetical protein